MRQYLLKRDNWDERDHLFARSPISLPAKLDLRSKCSPIVNQGELGSCTANAIASGLREFMELKAGKTLVPLSRLYLYYKEREMEGTINEDAGASIRDGMQILQKIGVCPETDMPYDISKFNQAPTNKAELDAENYIVASYQRLGTLSDIKRSIYEGYPVVMGIKVYESFESEQVAKTGKVPLPRTGEQNLGGHAVLVVGYQESAFLGLVTGSLIVRNSWGEEWGDLGYCYIPYTFLSKGYAFDYWTAR